MTTEELLQKCVKRDRFAWDEFARRYHGLVTKSVGHKLHKLGVRLSKTEVLDIVQEIFLVIWEKDRLSGVKDTSTLKGWLVIVSMNFASNYYKKNTTRAARNTLSLDEVSSSENPEITLGSMIPSSTFDTAKTLESNELRNILKTEISKLDCRQQLALKLNIYDGKTQKDIAEIMNLPTGTIATLITRAKKRLRERLRIVLGS